MNIDETIKLLESQIAEANKLLEKIKKEKGEKHHHNWGKSVITPSTGSVKKDTPSPNVHALTHLPASCILSTSPSVRNSYLMLNDEI